MVLIGTVALPREECNVLADDGVSQTAFTSTDGGRLGT